MHSHNLVRSQRIPLLRPLRPPSRQPPPRSRPFCRSSPHSTISQQSSRPQLPYLSQPAQFRQQPFINYQITRILSTEARAHYTEQVWIAARWSAILAAFLFFGHVAYNGVLMEIAEQENPTPREWKFFTRHIMRAAREELKAVKEKKSVVVDWAKVASYLDEVLRRLEDPKYDGKGLRPAGADETDGFQEENILIPGIGKAGYDISAKSYEWRTCYFEVLMGCAATGEHLDDSVLDTTRNLVFPKSVVVGPSNPDPRPVPLQSHAKGIPPREEDCEPAFKAPEVFYLRILTSKGFTTKQKLQAAEGYANWLDFKGLPSSAEEMHRWGLDIAKAALPLPPNVIVDERTDVLKAEAGKEVTSNLLQASTALAIHHARNGNVAAALPMFLSILRARREAPVSTDPLSLQDDEPEPRTDIGNGISFVRNLMKAPQFPPPPPSGDEPYTKPSDIATCEESEIMLYVGEILFANDARERSFEGVGWTREAVRIAEANLNRSALGAGVEREKCKQCLLTGAQNWEVMLRRLSSRQASSAAREGGRDAGWLEWRGWFGKDGGVKGNVLDQAATGVVAEELKVVESLRAKILRDRLEEEDNQRGLSRRYGWFG